MTVLDELKWRGLLAECTDEQALSEHLDAGPVTFYVGFDPSAPSLHFGNLVQLIVARHLQRAGHHPLLLVGGSTGLIGDPKGSGERPLLSKEIVAGRVQQIRRQVSRFLDMEGTNPARVVNNLDWTESLSVLDFLRDVGKHFPVNRMLERDVVRTRLDSGISYTEFSYVLLQAMDYLNLYRQYGCTLQFGASDQWGNIAAGVELIRRADGGQAHGMATPLLTKADGAKFGKTESGTIWLNRELTSPFAFHQFFLNAEDAKVIEYLKVFSSRSREEIDELDSQTREHPERRAAQHALADDITDLVHSPEERRAAQAAGSALFAGSDLTTLSAAVLGDVAAELGSVPLDGGDEPPLLADAMTASGVVGSKSAARRTIAEGGAYLNNVKVDDPQRRIEPGDLLAGGYAVLRRGKKTVSMVHLPA